MAVVKRNTAGGRAGDARASRHHRAAVQEGGCDFLGQVVVELELPNQHMGQFFTPYDVSRMMAEMTFDTVDEIIAEQGFVTVQEPACGAGGMIIAAADVLSGRGFDIGRQLYVDATDISPMCFRMSYLQASLRGIPATIRRGNTLSREMFEHAVTPAFLPFYAAHKESFDAWQRGEGRGGAASYDAEVTHRDAEAQLIEPEPVKPARPTAQSRPREAGQPRQLDLFGRDP